jgi:hypothetical protein
LSTVASLQRFLGRIRKLSTAARDKKWPAKIIQSLTDLDRARSIRRVTIALLDLIRVAAAGWR